jgi:hypothetical protein
MRYPMYNFSGVGVFSPVQELADWWGMVGSHDIGACDVNRSRKGDDGEIVLGGG